MHLRPILLLAMLTLMTAGCGGDSGVDREQAATDIGNQLALRLTESILRASTANTDTETTRSLRDLEESMMESIGDLALPEGIADVVAGTNAGYSAVNGYSSASMALTVIPADEKPLFCMVFAIGSDGTVIARPAPGDPVNRCADTELANPLLPE